MRTALVALIVLLAGCASATEAPAVQEVPRGEIQGIVVDAAIRPLADVTIDLDGALTRTDREGRFAFGGLAPGNYSLTAHKDGFEETVATTQTGEITRLVMLPIIVAEPYTIALKFNGHIRCGFSFVAAAMACSGIMDYSRHEYTAEDTGGTMDFAQTEMLWRSTQAAGDRLSLRHSARETDAMLIDYDQARGLSPLVVRSNATTLDQYGIPHNDTLHIRIFNAPIEGTDIGETYGDPTDGDDCIERPVVLPGCFTGVGVTVDQPVVVYTHIFHDHTPAPDWQFSVHGDP